MTEALAAIGRHGRWMLVVGLVAGMLLPSLAAFMRPYLLPLIAVILFLSMLRVSPEQVATALTHARRDIPILLALQFLLPLVLAAILPLLGVGGSLGDVLVLMAAAAPIAGGAGIAVLAGLDGMTALRLLVWGTLLLPVTSILPLQIVFSGESVSVFGPALRLIGIIFSAGGLALVVRRFLLRRIEGRRLECLDGLAALFLAGFVLSLMDAIQPMLLRDPIQVLLMLAAAFAANFGLQIAVDRLLKAGSTGRVPREVRGSVALVAGNRNLGLFLAALPPAVMDPMMVFVGCYQIPMFLTPVLMARYYRS